MAKKTRKVWFVRSCRYGYMVINKTTKPLMNECNEGAGILWCYSSKLEEKMIPHVQQFLDYGEIDERTIKWK